MNGILLVDKPSDWTSNDVVVKLKGALHQRRIGHSGTLDPMATGLLVVFVGRATRAVSFAEADDKEYRAGLRLGLTTDTQDITGTAIEIKPSAVSQIRLEAALRHFIGEQAQIPPMYSAVKVNGRKLYDIARKGGEVERKARKINISKLSCDGMQGEDYILTVCCSKGTYIRTLCHDIGQYLGCGGCMSSLRRTRAGMFSVAQAHSLDEILQAAANGTVQKLLLPVDRLFAHCPSYHATAAETKKIKVGNDIPSTLKAGQYRVYAPDDEFLMLGRVSDGNLKTVKSFFEVEDTA